jgi:hypothetical protein
MSRSSVGSPQWCAPSSPRGRVPAVACEQTVVGTLHVRWAIMMRRLALSECLFGSGLRSRWRVAGSRIIT